MQGFHQAQFSKKPLLFLNSSTVAYVLGTLAAIAAIVQLTLGAAPTVLTIAVLASALGLCGFRALGAYNLVAWVVLLYTLGNVLVALYAKTLLGQPLDSHLSAPAMSFLVLLICVGALCIAAFMVRRIHIGRAFFTGTSDLRFLVFLSWACFWLGTFFWICNRWLQGPEGSGFGGLAVFRDLLVMAVIARTAMLLLRGGCRWNMDVRLVFMMLAAMLMGFLDNQKTAMALPVAGHFLTVLFFRRGLPWRSVALVAAGAIVFVALLAPVIHALRAMGQQQLGLGERIEFVAQHLKQLAVDPDSREQFEEAASAHFKHGYYAYFGDGGKGQMLLGRFASVQQIDPVIAAVGRSRPLGGEAVWPALARLVPSFINPDKPEYVEAYHTLVHYRLIHPAGGKFPTLPLAGQSYAAYGWPGVVLIPFFTFLVLFLVLKKLGWNLHQNIYAIFFLCSFVLIYVSQGDFGQYAGAVLRNFPLFAAVFWLIHVSYRMRILKEIPAASIRGQRADTTPYHETGFS